MHTFARAASVVAVGVIVVGGALYAGAADPGATATSSAAAASRPSPPPDAGATSTNPATSIPNATEMVAGPGLVAWDADGRIWVVNSDGTDLREVVPSAPRPNRATVIGWAPDGSRLLYTIPNTEGFYGMGIGLADGRGSEVAAYQNLCPIATQAGDPLASCVPELERVGMSLVGISPDGGRVAYAVWGPRSASDTDVLTSAIAVLDLATGRVKTLDATRFGRNESGRQSIYRSPTWSADGTRIVFVRMRFGPGAIVEGEQQYDVLTVDDDGGNLHAIEPPDAPSRQLGPWFTWDGRVVSISWTEPRRHRGDAWVTDPDGGNPMQLDMTIPALTAAGCMICPYPVSAGADPLAVRTTHPFEEFFITTMYWQPSRASQP